MGERSNGSRSIKRRRRTAEDMAKIRQAIRHVLEQGHPMSVRQVYYQLTTLGVIDKTEQDYKSTVVRLLGEMRRDGSIPYLWLADSTRWMRKPTTYDSAADAVDQLASVYRRNLWTDSDVVEVWVEKEALAGVLVEVTERWDVPLMVTRGYPSMSYLYSAAVPMVERWLDGRETFIYYMGDHDPSGVDIDDKVILGIGEAARRIASGSKVWEKVERRVIQDEREKVRDSEGREATEDELELLRGAVSSTVFGRGSKELEKLRNVFAFATFGGHFNRLGVLPWQIEEWELPSRPTKSTDTRSKNFTGESVELDAIPADRLRDLAEEAIERHVDTAKLKVLETVEEEERRGLEQLAAGFRGEG
jgi:hypothetical protein